jgi:3-isopropylmalate dehydrogenase
MLESAVRNMPAESAASPTQRLTDSLVRPMAAFDPASTHHIGVFVGEGVGPEVVPVALDLLDRLAAKSGRRLSITTGGVIGAAAKKLHGTSLTGEAIDFAREVFANDGALFCGPGGDRFVYELRREFDLYCKFTPIEPLPELRDTGQVRPEAVAEADIVAVRENMAGIYQGEWNDERVGSDRVTSHRFEYRQSTVERILNVAIDLAGKRRRRLHVVLKPGGIPSVSALWRDCAERLCGQAAVELFEQEIDNAVYQLIANPGQFDVIVSPNMFGDVLADCAALLLASRGLSYSGNFNDRGNGAYQTGHGAARDIAGKDVANPLGQVLALGMMLRENFSWPEADAALRAAIQATLAAGYRTADIASPSTQVVGTRQFGEMLGAQLDDVLQRQQV